MRMDGASLEPETPSATSWLELLGQVTMCKRQGGPVPESCRTEMRRWELSVGRRQLPGTLPWPGNM